MPEAVQIRDWRDVALERLDTIAKMQRDTQTFFAELAAEITKPSVGDMFRDHVRVILRRAAEKGIYVPAPS